MAIKSIKFYNFQGTLGSHGSLNVHFYDKNGNLIPLDFSNPLSTPSATYCETLECIVTANGCYGSHYHYYAFHSGNTNINCGLSRIGPTWLPSGAAFSSSDWIKIEFKHQQDFGDIKVLHTYHSSCGFTSCNYEVEHEHGNTKAYYYLSNGLTNTYPASVMDSRGFDQEILDAQFDSIEFDSSSYIYDTEIGYVETLDTNNFKNIPVNTVEKLKVLYTKPINTILNCVVSFDQKQTWKTFDGTNWSTISDTTPENMILNCMEIEMLNYLDKNKLITGGFTGDLDFKIAMKTNNTEKTPSVTKIYIQYK